MRYYRKDDQEPAHPRVIFHFPDDFHLAYDYQRKLGTVELIANPGALVSHVHLGPDALAVGFGEFQRRLCEQRGSLKPLLMTQGFIAGLGSEYTDEILFQARLHPAGSAGKLDRRAIRRLFRVMKRVLGRAIRCQADPGRMPRSWLHRHRHKGGKCPRCGKPLRTGKVTGRTAYWCEQCQK